jgi:hypothetical protein
VRVGRNRSLTRPPAAAPPYETLYETLYETPIMGRAVARIDARRAITHPKKPVTMVMGIRSSGFTRSWSIKACTSAAISSAREAFCGATRVAARDDARRRMQRCALGRGGAMVKGAARAVVGARRGARTGRTTAEHVEDDILCLGLLDHTCKRRCNA